MIAKDKRIKKKYKMRRFFSKIQKKPKVLFILGGPGSGKGTMCDLLVKDHNFIHLSAGELLREEMNKETENSKLIESIMVSGKIVPVEITVGLLKQAMEQNGWGEAKFLVDGFPRNEDNFRGWEEVIGDEADVEGILLFNCSEEVMRERLLRRGLSSGRSDDKEEVILKRFRTYEEDTCPAVREFEEKGGVVFELDGDGSIEDVYEDVKEVMRNFKF